MKNLIYPIIAALGLSFGATAQTENDTIRISVNGSEIVISSSDLNELSSVDINGMLKEFSEGMQAAAKEFKAKMADIDAREESGEINEDQAEEEREAAEEEFEERAEQLADEMEMKADAIEENMENEAESWEAWAEKWEDDAEDMEERSESNSERHIIIDEEGMRIEDRIREEIIIDDNDGYKSDKGIIGFHFGWNTLYNSDMQLAGGEAEVDFFNSWKYDLEFGHDIRLGKKSPLFFRYGLNFAWYSFETKQPLAKFPDPNNPDQPSVDFVDPGFTVSDAEFDIAYMDIPLMLRLDFSGKGIGNGWQLGVGGYGGVRLSSDREIEYRDFNGDDIEERVKDSYLSNQWRYGLMGQIGYGSFHITARYDLSQLFEERFDTPDYQAASLTLGFVF